MHKFVIVFALVVLAAAAPNSSASKEALRRLPALQHEEVHDDYGRYSTRYVTAEGTIVSERGRQVPSHFDGTGHVHVTDDEVEYQ